jgi:hypothetical protein
MNPSLKKTLTVLVRLIDVLLAPITFLGAVWLKLIISSFLSEIFVML